MRIEHTVQIWREGADYVAQAVPLDLMSCGPTPEAARENLAEAVRLFIETAQGMGTLGEILEECGYVQSGNEWLGPEHIATERQAVGV